MSIVKVGRVSGPHSPNIHLGSAAGSLASVCLTAPDKADDVAGQTRQILTTIAHHLADLGSGHDQVVFVQVWLAEITDHPGFVAAWNDWVDPRQPPALSVVQAPAARRDSLVEIRAYAAR